MYHQLEDLASFFPLLSYVPITSWPPRHEADKMSSTATDKSIQQLVDAMLAGTTKHFRQKTESSSWRIMPSTSPPAGFDFPSVQVGWWE